MNDQYVERVIDLTDPDRESHSQHDASRRRAPAWPWARPAACARSTAPSRSSRGTGEAVRLARSLDRPLRYFLAKRSEGPALVVVGPHRRDPRVPRRRGARRPVPSELHAHGAGAPRRRDPCSSAARTRTPTYTRFFTPASGTAAGGPGGDRAALRRRPGRRDRQLAREPFPKRSPSASASPAASTAARSSCSTYHVLRKLGRQSGAAQGLHAVARRRRRTSTRRGVSSRRSTSSCSSSRSRLSPGDLDPFEAVRVDRGLQAARRRMRRRWRSRSAAASAQRYPEWRYLLDGDGGDENLKDYPIEENPELTIRSVLTNPLLYQEGWGVGPDEALADLLGRTEPLLRAHVRAGAAVRLHGAFSPFTRPRVIEVAEDIPFAELTGGDHQRLYALKGEIVSPRRRGRDGTAHAGLSEAPLPAREPFAPGELARRFPFREADYRMHFLSRYA